MLITKNRVDDGWVLTQGDISTIFDHRKHNENTKNVELYMCGWLVGMVFEASARAFESQFIEVGGCINES